MRLRIHSIHIILFLLFFTPFLCAPAIVGAQEPCGDIIIPATAFDPEVITHITNCQDPFHATTDTVSPYTLKVDQTIIHTGDSIAVAVGGTAGIQITGAPLLSEANHRLYLHDGNNYRYTSLEPPQAGEADYRALALLYFPVGTDIEPYVRAAIERDYSSYDEDFQNTLFPFLDYIDANFIPVSPKLRAGTYTLVTNDDLLILTHQTVIEKALSFLIPKAYAQSPGDFPAYVFTITFTITEVPPLPIGASSVLFLPGIQASRLYTQGLLGTEDQLWEANGNQDVRQLEMAQSGESTQQVYTKDIAPKVYGFVSIYAGFSNYMDTLVDDGVIKEWMPFAYDWRYSVDDIAQNGTQYQNEVKNAVDEIERLASSSFSGKVTIVGHSNGGLLAKAVVLRLQALGKANLVDAVVLLASPQLGTPKAIASMLHGYDQEIGGGYVVDDFVARESMKNMPGAYGLIPSPQYFNAATSTLISFDTSSSTQLFRNAYGVSIDSPAELSSFMAGTGDGRTEATTVDEAMRLNLTLLQKEQLLHRSILDSWIAPQGVKVVEVIGVGLDTISGFEYREFTERICKSLGVFSCSIKNLYKPVPTISQFGDKTVMGQSAQGYQGAKEQYFIDLLGVKQTGSLIEHYNITEALQTQHLLKNILKHATSTIEFITPVPQVSPVNRIMFGSHSPVTISVTDKQGKKAGKGIENGVSIAITDIPGSSYFELGSSTYVIVPDGIQYDVLVKGTSQGGLTFTLDTLKGETQEAVVSVRVATITPSTTVNVSYTNSVLTNLSIDQNSDGVADQVLTPQGVDVTPKVTYKMLRDALQKLSLTNARKAPLLLLAIVAETFDKNPKLSVLETKTLNELESLLILYQKNKWITQTDLTNLKNIINKLK